MTKPYPWNVETTPVEPPDGQVIITIAMERPDRQTRHVSLNLTEDQVSSLTTKAGWGQFLVPALYALICGVK